MAVNKESLKIDEATRKEIAHASIDEKKDMYVLVGEAWKAYKREKLRRQPLPADQDLIQRLLRLWYKPKGMEIPLREMMAIAIEMPEPEDPHEQ